MECRVRGKRVRDGTEAGRRGRVVEDCVSLNEVLREARDDDRGARCDDKRSAEQEHDSASALEPHLPLHIRVCDNNDRNEV
jgi:hypothetical protein